MKKILIIIMLIIAFKANAQTNLQLHYDFGNGRKFLTSTVEMFKPDTLGSTFFFVDFNYNAAGPTEGYWEIARELKFWKAPFSVHVEYNGGLNALLPLQFNNAYLLGGTYSWNSADFSKGISLSAMYKMIQGNDSPHNFQLTGVWYVNMLKDKLSFTGFADFWREKQSFIGTSYVFISEPQLWYNVNKAFSVGTEVEFGYNFGGSGMNICPTLGVKWNL
ncbi:MAG TPA: DUF5020 family protein [Paludibacter sp.]|nr:DUF5020 family protein [Paludibacter sp.]